MDSAHVTWHGKSPVRTNSHLAVLGALWSLAVASGCAPTPLHAQVVPVSFGRYALDSWRAQDGVRLAYTSNLVLTRDGYLWLSCESGVTRFDGARFKVFDGAVAPALRGRPRLQTVPLLEDGDGKLIIGTDLGLLAYANGTIRPAELNATFQIDQVNAATVDAKKTVWAVTRSGRVFSIPHRGKLHEVAGTILSYSGSSLSVDPTGDVWIAAGQNAVYRVHNDSLTKVDFPTGARVDDPNRAYAAADSSVWFGTPTAVIQWRHGRVTRFDLPKQDALGAVSTIAAAPDGALWIGTHGAGLYRFMDGRFTNFSTRDGLSDDRVIDILPDASGNIWVATRDGLNRFRPVPFDVVTSRTGLPTALPGGMRRDASGVTWLAPPTGGLFAGTVDAGNAAFRQVEAVRNYDRVTALAAGANGGIIAGRLLGSVSRFRDRAGPAQSLIDRLPPVTDIHEDADGVLWIGTWRGLFRLSAPGARDSLTARDGLPDDFIHRIHRDAGGTLWVATQTGIARAIGPRETRFATQAMPENGATRATVLFEAPRGTVWLGSAEGLTRVSGGKPAHLTVSHGLPDNWIGAAEQDADGNLWLGQLAGLTRVRVPELAAIADGRASALTTVTTYAVLDGLPGGDPGAWPHPWSFTTPQGALWFAMGHGIAMVTPNRVVQGTRAPAMHIEELMIDGAGVPLTQPIDVTPRSRRVEIRYTGADLTNGPRVRFRYQLVGFDTTWTDVGTQRVASFTSLAPGHYKFRVAGRAANGGWGVEEASVAFLVSAPVYRRPWFLAAVTALVALLLWTAHLGRLATQGAAVREERSRLAREIHDSLLQGFSGIALELHAASARLALPAAQQQRLDHVLSLIDRTLVQAREVVWDIRQPGETGTEFVAGCEAAGHRIFGDTDTTFRVDVTGQPSRLTPRVQRECLRIVEEALMNIRKHAASPDALVEVQFRWSEVAVAIRDSGAGFDSGDAARQSGHWGLLGMRERASRIGASLILQTAPGAGTVVMLVVPTRRRLLRKFFGG
ncbi:MAG: hypothetical protein H7099_16620 [Gemmatimonadaceae bacterium]|nr:hypothetical protein [Gemmatimonadaceae bacterium]